MTPSALQMIIMKIIITTVMRITITTPNNHKTIRASNYCQKKTASDYFYGHCTRSSILFLHLNHISVQYIHLPLNKKTNRTQVYTLPPSLLPLPSYERHLEKRRKTLPCDNLCNSAESHFMTDAATT